MKTQQESDASWSRWGYRTDATRWDSTTSSKSDEKCIDSKNPERAPRLFLELTVYFYFMNIIPSPECIENIARAHFLQQQTSQKTETILWESEENEWGYQIIGQWMQTTTFLITIGGQNFALKLSNNEKFLWDTRKEIWVSDFLRQRNPKIFSHGEGQLPGMVGRYFWNVQEYIPWPLWSDSEMNNEQLESYLSQLRSIHSFAHPWVPKWWPVMDDLDWAEESFAKYTEIFRRKINECTFFSQENRRERVLSEIEKLQWKIWDMWNYKTILIHNDAHPQNVILDSPESARIIDYWNMKWSCPEEELAVIQTHCIGSRMWLFQRILEGYKNKRSFDDNLFEFFTLLNACSKINTRRKKTEKQLLIWTQLVEPMLSTA